MHGDNTYYVDGDSQIVNNFSDLQTARYSLATNWRLWDKLGILLVAGESHFTTDLTNINYTKRFLFIKLNMPY